MSECERTTKQNNGGHCFHYSRDRLLEIRSRPLPAIPPTALSNYSQIKASFKKKRKRGQRGGVKLRIRRRGFKPPLPTIVLSNIRSLRNKSDDLSALSKHDSDFRTASLICLTETWLSETDPDRNFELDNFVLVRKDRDACSGKSKGGGLCIYVNELWCKNVNINTTTNSPDIEFLSLSLRPHYLPREFKVITIINVYVPPTAKIDNAKQVLEDHVSFISSKHPTSPLIIVGDFNHCQQNIAGFSQYVSCKTRYNRTLDLCYCNIKNAYKSIQKSPIASSDHNTIHLIPTYTSKLKSSKPVVRQSLEWSQNSIDKLKACFDCTDWDVFTQIDDSIDEWTTVISSYIEFCIDLCVEKREFKIYPNNKPWITKKLKYAINKKKIAHMNGNIREEFECKKEIRKLIKEEKEGYKNKMEEQLRNGDSAIAWEMIRKMGGVEQKRNINKIEGDKINANDLNEFYCRFDNQPPIFEIVTENHTPPPVIEEQTVSELFRRCNSKKAPGPDNITGHALKHCHEQLSIPFTKTFQRSLEQRTVPQLWKMSTVVPVPKKKNPAEMNDYRPVALTSLVMKCFEKIIKCQLLQMCYDKDILDPYQFAYQSTLSVEDALLTLVNTITKHLDASPKHYARLLYVDFSSAFNAMKTDTLLKKMCDMNFPSYLIEWFQDFLIDRPQVVKFSNETSSKKLISNGCPQGCVTSPVLYILYTNDCTPSHDNCRIIKYADDTAILGLLSDAQSEENYFREIKLFEKWCLKNDLQLNVRKTKEQIFDNNVFTISINTDPLPPSSSSQSTSSPSSSSSSPPLPSSSTMKSTIDNNVVYDANNNGDNTNDNKNNNIGSDSSSKNSNRNIKNIVKESVKIGNETVETIYDFKYLGVWISSNLNFRKHVDTITKKAKQRMYVLRKLRSFNVSKKTLLQVYTSLIQSIIVFGCTIWYGGSRLKEQSQVRNIIKDASKIINQQLDGPEKLHTKALERKAFSIINNKKHILFNEFNLLPSGKRYTLAKCRTNKYKTTFIPTALKSLNTILSDQKNK